MGCTESSQISAPPASIFPLVGDNGAEQADNGQNVLIIDGAYMQIGLRDLNREHNTKFRLERSSNMLRLLAVV